MTDILPPAGWLNVRQLETNEFATGGANGNMNEQAKSLAARSELLKQYTALPYESKTGGYALNERVQLATGDIVRSTIASNVNNPNENMTGWRFNDNTVESIADLLAMQNPKEGQVVYAKSYHAGLNKGGDLFEYKSARQLENDGGNTINGWVRQVPPNYLNVQNFGAIGDGLSTAYDHDAFNKIKSVITDSSLNSFVVHVPFAEYLVGKQEFINGTGWVATDIFDISFTAMTEKSIIVKCDGATIKAKDGLRFGVFSKTTGEPFQTTMPFYPGTPSWDSESQLAARVGVGHLMNFENIKNLAIYGNMKLDGNRDGAIIGGQYGDVGWQITAYGLRVCNVEKFSIENIDTYDHLLDGLYIAGCNSKTSPDVFNPNYSGSIRNVHSLRNSRQGCSFTGGQNISFYDCNFADTALPSFSLTSPPSSNLDIEAEINPIRNANFYNCRFGTASGTSLVAASSDSRGVNFHNCRFINAIGSTMWVQKPEFKFFNCYFNGYAEGSYKTNIHKDRTVYNDCEFTDDPIVNPNFVPRTANLPLLDQSNANPIFNNCEMNIHKLGIISNYGYVGKFPPQFNNMLINIYSTNEYCAWAGDITCRIRDYRDPRFGMFPTIRLNSGKIVVEQLDELNNEIFVFGSPYTVTRTIEDISSVYLKVGSTVAPAIGTDDTSVKLNALIKSLKDSKQIA